MQYTGGTDTNFGLVLSNLASLIFSVFGQFMPQAPAGSQMRQSGNRNTGGLGYSSYNYQTSNSANPMQPGQNYNYTYSWQSGNGDSGGGNQGNAGGSQGNVGNWGSQGNAGTGGSQGISTGYNQQSSNSAGGVSGDGNNQDSYDYVGSSGDYQTGGPDNYQSSSSGSAFSSSGASGSSNPVRPFSGTFTSNNQQGVGYSSAGNAGGGSFGGNSPGMGSGAADFGGNNAGMGSGGTSFGGNNPGMGSGSSSFGSNTGMGSGGAGFGGNNVGMGGGGLGFGGNTQSQGAGRMAPSRPLVPILNTNNQPTPGIGPDSYQQSAGNAGNSLGFSGSAGGSSVSNPTSYNDITGAGEVPETWQGGNAIYATGYTGAAGSCVLEGTDYYVNMRNELIRVDPTAEMIGTDTEVRIAGNVAYAFHGMDDALWFVDTNGKLWRMHYRKAPEMVPNQPQVRFARVSPRTYDEAICVTATGDLYRYVGHKWIRDRSASNVRDVGLGNAGQQMYVDRNQRIFVWNWESYSWVPYEVNGKGFDLYDSDHVVVFDDANNVRKRVNGRWVGDTEKCKDVFVREDSYYCITPSNAVRIVPY